MKFELRWDPELTEFYKHGSTIAYTKEGVRFENKMLSPGATIVTWVSNPNYQGKRGWLELPLLERGKEYHVKINSKSFPKPFVPLKIEFYNRAEESLCIQVIMNQKGSFRYPKQAYSYSMSLLNTGIEEVMLKNIILQSKDKQHFTFAGENKTIP